MKDHIHNMGQLPLDFSSRNDGCEAVVDSSKNCDQHHKRFFLVVNNAPLSSSPVSAELDPNSPEITNILLSVGKSLGW